MNAPNSIFRSSKPAPLQRRFSESSTSLDRPNQNEIFRRPRLSRTPSEGTSALSTPSPARSITPQGHGEKPPQPQLPPTISRKPDLHLNLRASPVSGSKRSLNQASLSPPSAAAPSHPSRKRARVYDRPQKPLHAFNLASPSDGPPTPPSPLFFSNSPRSRPELPHRYSSAEAAAKMLSKTKGEDATVKTVTLPRGSYLNGSPPTSRPKPRSHLSHETIHSARTDSPSLSEESEQLGLLSQIGFTELLDQDDRPTFIVDLADHTNLESGGLKILFANPALRSYGTLLDAISGRIDDHASDSFLPKSLPQFKDWLLSDSVKGDALSMEWPGSAQGTISWSCSTLRKRLRIVSGVRLSQDSSVSPLLAKSPEPVLSPTVSHKTVNVADASFGHPEALGVQPRYAEAQDYFGDAGPRDPNSTSGIETRDSTALSNNDALHLDEPSLHMGLGITSNERPTNLTARATSDPSMSKIDLEEASSGNTPSEASKEVGFFDWTRLSNVGDLPSHIQFARSVDWAATALGPIHTWSADLRQMCNLIMASPHPAAMYWGEDLVAIYNEAYVFLAGQKHPQLMGQSYREAWAEIWDEVKDVFAGAQTTGQATMKDDDCLFIRRSGTLEETYFSWSIIPMVGGDGSVMGLYNPAFEKTRRKIAERRMLTLREVGERTAAARDVKSFWEEVLTALDCNEFDTPFVLLYSLNDEDASDESSVASNSRSGNARQCLLEGSLGVPEGHAAAPECVDLKSGTEGFVSVFREVTETHRPAVLDVANGDFSEELLEGLEWRGFGDPSKSIVVCPIHPTTGESILGFLVMGINPRRPYDDDYSLFVQLLSRQLATSLASVVLFEEEIKRGQRAAKLAALDRIELSEQLAARTREAIESETKFTRMAEFAPVGMFIADSDGRISYCNDTWYEISRIPKENECTDKWVDFVVDEDKVLVQKLWHDLVENTKPVTAEWRFKAPSTNQDGSQGHTWVLFSAYPERYSGGALKSVFGSITNISQQKWAEGLQKKKTEEAIEMKRQQENFIDTTSHEMRNPLSAILQCADEIMTSLSEAKSQRQGDEVLLYDTNIDAAQTIALCAQHQKRIVDDVLTVSKLDSALLMVTPVDAQPMTVVHRALKMFEGELQNADIDIKFIIDDSYKNLNIDWVRFDPSRVLQVLINLTTNAIKFTTTEQKRTITVTLSASRSRPSAEDSPLVSYIPRRSNLVDTTKSPDWGSGEEVFVHFSVQDTGRGLTEEEKKTLFLRFKQASPRTHVQYGGSGLGLFISRELTELQGGQIGVASASGQGSTFSFYVKARRSTAPAGILIDQMPPALQVRRTSDGKGSIRKAGASPRGDHAASESSSRAERQGNLNILIVEDNLVNQRVLQKQLLKKGCVVHVANHGGEALDKLRESNFWSGNEGKDGAIDVSLVLLDVEMPVMDGLTCIKRIRAMEQSGELRGHVPVIAVTANARQEQLDHALSHGMDRVITKPFGIPELMEKMTELVEDERMRNHSK